MPSVFYQSLLDPRALRCLLPAFAGCVFILYLFANNNHDISLRNSDHWNPWSVSAARQRSLDQISNSTLGFEKVFAVNLASRTDYRDALTLASRLTSFDIEFIDGVLASDVDHKVMPPNHNDDLTGGALGAWQAHVKTLQKIVHENISTALIFESDIDWDIRIKSQLQDFAVSSNALLRAKQKHISGDIAFDKVPQDEHVPKTSPYGDGWDILWLGHCEETMTDGPRILHFGDATTAALKHNWFWSGMQAGDLAPYPEHTRAVFPLNTGTCTYAYAVSQLGAQKLLYQVSRNDLPGAFDISLSRFCAGQLAGDTHGPRSCIGVLPSLFMAHWARGDTSGDSDIGATGGGFREKAWTPGIRHSVTLNMQRLLDGEEVEDQFPEDE